MNTDRRKILEMLAQQKISVAEADELMSAISEKSGTSEAPTSGSPKYLRIEVNSRGDKVGDKVNVKVPFQLLRAGVKIAAFIPKMAQDKVNEALNEHGIDISNIKSGHIEELINHLSDLQVDVDSANGERVRVYCE